MDKTKTVGQKWLAREVDLHFLTLKKCTKGQFNQVIVLTNYKSTDRHADTQQIGRHIRQKTIFSGSKGLKTWKFDKNGGAGGGKFYANLTFSDENVKKSIYFNSLD